MAKSKSDPIAAYPITAEFALVITELNDMYAWNYFSGEKRTVKSRVYFNSKGEAFIVRRKTKYFLSDFVMLDKGGKLL